MELQKDISLQKNRRWVGRTLEVLVEGRDASKAVLKGRTERQAPEIDGHVLLKGKALPGDWVEARITDALPYDLVGEIVKPLP